jgi:hypothetical protein
MEGSSMRKVREGHYVSPSGTFTAERVRYRTWWGNYEWAYELVWHGNTTGRYGGRMWVSNPYGNRVVCRTLADARAIVNRYEKARV